MVGGRGHSSVAKNYRELIVWQEAMDLVEQVYRLSKDWPADERFGLTNQIRRATVSIAANIAEGEGRGTDPDFCRFLRIAHGSLREVETHALIALRLTYSTDAQIGDVLDKSGQLG